MKHLSSITYTLLLCFTSLQAVPDITLDDQLLKINNPWEALMFINKTTFAYSPIPSGSDYFHLSFNDSDGRLTSTFQTFFQYQGQQVTYSYSQRPLGKMKTPTPFVASQLRIITLPKGEKLWLSVRLRGRLSRDETPELRQHIWNRMSAYRRLVKHTLHKEDAFSKPVNSFDSLDDLIQRSPSLTPKQLTFPPSILAALKVDISEAIIDFESPELAYPRILFYQKNAQGVWQKPVIQFP